jgi:type VI secretion system protein VasD
MGGLRKETGSALRWSIASACAVLMTACSSTGDGSGMVDRTLQAVGLERPQPQMPTLDGVSGIMPANGLPNAPPVARKITFRLHAGDVLNTDSSGRSLSIVARIYKLKDRTAFDAAPYPDFQELKPAKGTPFDSDIVDVREVVLTPGKQYDVIETVGVDAPYFAVVALFRAPAEQRWRFVFDSKAAASTGISMGVHACALSVSAGQPLDTAPEMMRVAGVHCPGAGT